MSPKHTHAEKRRGMKREQGVNCKIFVMIWLIWLNGTKNHVVVTMLRYVILQYLDVHKETFTKNWTKWSCSFRFFVCVKKGLCKVCYATLALLSITLVIMVQDEKFRYFIMMNPEVPVSIQKHTVTNKIMRYIYFWENCHLGKRRPTEALLFQVILVAKDVLLEYPIVQYSFFSARKSTLTQRVAIPLIYLTLDQPPNTSVTVSTISEYCSRRSMNLHVQVIS